MSGRKDECRQVLLDHGIGSTSLSLASCLHVHVYLGGGSHANAPACNAAVPLASGNRLLHTPPRRARRRSGAGGTAKAYRSTARPATSASSPSASRSRPMLSVASRAGRDTRVDTDAGPPVVGAPRVGPAADTRPADERSGPLSGQPSVTREVSVDGIASRVTPSYIHTRCSSFNPVPRGREGC